MLMHAIYRITTTTTALYRKEDIRNLLWKTIRPLCQIDNTPYSSRGNIKNFKRGFDELFDYCWKQKFAKSNNSKEAIKISKIAYRNRTFANKLFNSNLCIFIFTGVFFAIQKWINDSYFYLQFTETKEIGLTFCVILSASVFTLGLLTGSTKRNAYYYFPLIAMVIMFLWSLNELFSGATYSSDISAEITISLIKRNIMMGISYLLWYPIIFINNDRLHDLYD